MKHHFCSRRAGATLLALLSLSSAPAMAQDICISPPNHVPGSGVDGPPKWIAADPNGTDTLHWLNDIRWADAGQDLFADQVSDANYRVVFDNDYLLVSIQSNEVAGDRTPNAESRVYFAVGHELNDKAVAVAIDLRAPSSTAAPNTPTEVTNVQTFLKDRVCVVNRAATATACTTDAQCGTGNKCATNWAELTPQRGGGRPSWLVTPAVWVNEALSPKICVNDMDTTATNKNAKPCIDNNNDGQADSSECGTQGGVCVQNDPQRALWGANFKIKISGTGGVGLPISDPLRMFVGTRMVALNPMAVRIHKRLPATTGIALADHLFDASNIDEAMVPRSLTTWAVSTPPNTPCLGASLVRSKIGHQTAAGNFDLVDLNVAAGNVSNSLIATVDCPGGCPADSLTARFRVANWGSNFGVLGWSSLIDRNNNSLISVDPNQHFTFNCKDNVAGVSTCGLLNTGLNAPSNGYYHQCMAVEINKGLGSATKISAGSEYVNTRFEMASTIQRVATIDVRGMAAKLGNSANRNIYLYVTRKNMPATTTKTLYLPRNEMVADRLDVLDMYSCKSSDPDVSCVGLDGPVGLCAYPCDGSGLCEETDARVDIEDECFCAVGGSDETVDVCYAGGPDGRDMRSVTGVDARLERTWPTYEVLSYFDTGRTVLSNGVSYKVLQPMTEFGMYVDHVGSHHGFTDSLTGLNGLTVTRVTTDLYRISVPSETQAKLQVKVTAQEASSVVPLTVLSGTSTNFGIFGTAEVVGISPVIYPLDLRRSTVRLDRLMNENGRELVRNLNAPRTLAPLPGALPTIATFLNTTGVDVSMEVIELPLLGRLTTTNAIAAAVDRPTACPFAIGTARLSTSFSINDTVNPVFATEALNDWACIPFVGMVAL